MSEYSEVKRRLAMSDYSEVKDSGKRQEFGTGSRRDTRDGKGRYDLIPPYFLKRLAVHLENGAVKYSQPEVIGIEQLVGLCSCGNQIATHFGLTSLAAFVETAMSAIFGIATRSLLSDNERTQGGGVLILRTASERGLMLSAIAPRQTQVGRPYLPSGVDMLSTDSLTRMASDYLARRVISVPSVSTGSEPADQTSTTITRQETLEGFFVHAATRLLASSEIRQRLFGEHSPTCPIRQLDASSNGILLRNDKNWEKGQPLSRYLDSAMRHLCAVLDKQDDEDHAAAVAWNMMAFMCTKRWIEGGGLPPELDDDDFIGVS